MKCAFYISANVIVYKFSRLFYIRECFPRKRKNVFKRNSYVRMLDFDSSFPVNNYYVVHWHVGLMDLSIVFKYLKVHSWLKISKCNFLSFVIPLKRKVNVIEYVVEGSGATLFQNPPNPKPEKVFF